MNPAMAALSTRAPLRQVAWSPLSAMWLVAWLCAMHFVPGELPLVRGRWFNLNGEGSLGTWFSVVLLFGVAAQAAALAQSSGRDRGARRFWLFVAGCFAWMSVDETIGLHELLSNRFETTWVLLYAPPALAVLGAMAWWCLPRPGAARLLLVGLLVQIAGGMGCELVWYLNEPLPEALLRAVIALEEGLEMTGMVLAAHACWLLLRPRLRLSPAAEAG